MRKKLAIFLATAVVASGLALWATMGTAGAIKQPTTLTFISHESQSKDVDVAQNGEFNLGDYFIFTDILTQNGKRSGFDTGQCALAHRKPFRFNCFATWKIPGGQVAGQATFKGTNGPLHIKIAVTGGTGDFQNARGYISLDDIKGTDKQRVTFHLLP